MPNMNFPNFPSDEDFNKVIKGIELFKELKNDISQIKVGMTLEDSEAIRYLLTNKTNDAGDWKRILSGKIEQLSVNYTCAQYYFNLGINDEEWWRNNYENGCIEYLPNLTDQERINKFMFDLFINNVFNIIFSTLDIIAQLINAKYQLGISVEKISYNKLFFKESKDKKKLELYINLKKKEPSLQQALSEIRDSEDQSVKLRNSFTHRVPPTELIGLYIDDPRKITSVDQIPKDEPLPMKESWKASILAGKSVTIDEMKIGQYMPSAEIISFAEKAVVYLEKTIKALR